MCLIQGELVLIDKNSLVTKYIQTSLDRIKSLK